MAMIDATYDKAHRAAAIISCDEKPRFLEKSRGGITTKLHHLCNSEGKPMDFVITAG